VALLSLAGSAPAMGPEAMAREAGCHCQHACKVPVFVSLEGGKIVVEPELLHIYWGTSIVFEIEAEASELVEIEFDKSPFKVERKPGWFGTKGGAKLATGPTIRPKDWPARDPDKIGRQKPAERVKYTVKWSGGRAAKAVMLDPVIIISDNGN